MNEINSDKDVLNGEVKSLPVNSVVFSTAPGTGIKFDICPFCFAVYIFSKDVINTINHKCACGARFTSLGHATKFIKSEVKI